MSQRSLAWFIQALASLCLLTLGAPFGLGQTTAFTYQGKLTDAGNPANGAHDLQFRLFDALVSANQIGSTIVREDVAVSGGIFTVTLDFGAAAFPGANRFLEIGVRPGASTGAFTTLAPLQPITATPYAVQSLNAATATNAATAANFSGALTGDVTGTQTATALSNNTVTTSKLANGSVTDAKIADVAGSKLTGSITTATIPGTNVTGAVPNATSAVNFSGTLAGDVTGTQSATALTTNAVTTPKLADGSVTDAKIAAVAGNKVTGTIPVAGVPAGSTNYIQNSAILQAGSNFNISGNGIIGGNVGIGTTNPALINGASGKMLSISDPLNPGVALTNTDLGGHQYFLYSNTNNGSLRVYDATVGTDRVVLHDNGDVLIGTTTNVNLSRLIVEGSGNKGELGGLSFGVSGSSSDFGVYGYSDIGRGVTGFSISGRAVHGVSGTAGAYAGYFEGKMRVTGVIEKPGGGFKIDHPLDPENKYLVHSFVESPDMKNLYDGTVTTDAKGEAEITLPDWFAALNRDFRYQLTCIGVFAQAIIAEKIKDNRFKIRTNLPNVEVSWQVTGTRQDAWAKQNRLPVEELKSEVERGFYQNPTAFGQPEEKSIEWARHPEMMKRQKADREKAAREQNNKDVAPAVRPNQR